jgi:hypothetical protein
MKVFLYKATFILFRKYVNFQFFNFYKVYLGAPSPRKEIHTILYLYLVLARVGPWISCECFHFPHLPNKTFSKSASLLRFFKIERTRSCMF